MRGTGKADVFVMLAHPVGHAKSPGIFNEKFEQKGLDSLMVPMSCKPADFDAFWAGISAAENVRGIIVSVPFKNIAFQKCSFAHARAARAQSTNAVRRADDGGWYADNFDGVGFIDALKGANHEISGKRVLQVGAGGAGSSIAFCIAEAGASELRISDMDGARAAKLAADVAATFPHCRAIAAAADPTGIDIAVNATSAGLKATDPLPLDVSKLTPEMLVIDIIMEPAETALLRKAKEIGCRIQMGRPMMDCQVQAIAEFFDIERKARNHG